MPESAWDRFVDRTPAPILLLLVSAAIGLAVAVAAALLGVETDDDTYERCEVRNQVESCFDVPINP